MIQSDQMKCQTKKWTLIFSVFWIMKMTSAAIPMSETITPPPIRPRRGMTNPLARPTSPSPRVPALGMPPSLLTDWSPNQIISGGVNINLAGVDAVLL
jgi:hypothetical protein